MLTTILCFLVTFFAQGLVIVYPPVFVFWFIFHTRIERWRPMGKKAYWYACSVWPIISGPLLFFRRSIFKVRWPVPWYMATIGVIALALACVVFWRASHVISRRTLLGIVELEPDHNPQPVMQTGIYARTRNPIYLAHWLLILGAAAISGYAANWVFFVADAAPLYILIRTEESELRARYGSDFESYMQRVPRFFPRWPW